MEHLDHPELETWEARRQWFEALERAHGDSGAASALSEQACALMIDLQATFCAGAWAATVILAATIADAQSHHSPRAPGLREDLAWLRQTRNVLVHETPGSPAFTVEDQWLNRRAWEREARRAVEVAIESLHPGGTAAGNNREQRA